MKKYIPHSLVLLFTVIAFQACKYDTLMLFDQKPNVYFTYLDGTDRALDSTNVRFFYILGTEATVDIPVSITGALSNVDRYAAFAVNTDLTTAVEGVHYEFLTNTITIPANSTSGQLGIRILRSPDLAIDREILKLSIRLEPNEQFDTEYKARLNTTTKVSRQVLEYPIYMSDILTKPRYWSSVNETYFLGTYSEKKFTLICELNGFPHSYLDGEPWYDSDGNLISQMTSTTASTYIQVYAKRTYIYLEAQKAAGNTIYEADGVTEMKLGPYANM